MAADPRATRRPAGWIIATIAPYAIAIAGHGAIVIGASRLPPVQWLLAASNDEARNAVELDLEAAESVADQPPPQPLETPEKPPPRDEAPADRHVATNDASRAVAPSIAPNVAPNLAPPRAAPVAQTASPPSDVASTPGGGAGEVSARPSSGDAATPIGHGEGPPPIDEYGGAAQAPSLGSTLGVTGQFALQASAAAPTTAPASPFVDADAANLSLGRTMRSRSKTAGVNVPAAGVVAGTVSTTMRAMSLPHNAHATFEVTLGPGGKVTGTRVVSSSAGDVAQWDAAAKSVQNALASQALTLAPDLAKTGVTVRVSVTQKHVYPTGTAKGADIKPVCANGILNELADAADDKPSKPVDPTVPLFQDENGRPCIPVGVSAVADASNIGAEKHIEVRTSFEVIVPGQADLPEQVDAINTDAPWVERGKAGPRPTLPQKARKYIHDREKKK